MASGGAALHHRRRQNSHVRVQRVDKPGVTETRLWGSYEKVTVIRYATAEENKR